jgi:transcription elongation factor GreA
MPTQRAGINPTDDDMEYITGEDKERLQAQLADCLAKRKVITKRIEEARELGDLRENAEYHAAREDQGMNEARIHDIETKLANAIVTDGETVPDGMVVVGATVRLRNVDSGDEDTYRLVGDASGHIDPDADLTEVTPQSPMGEALFKARVGDTIRVAARRGTRHYEIIEIIA